MIKIRLFLLIMLLVVGPAVAATYTDISELGTSAGMIGLGNVGGFTQSAAVLLEVPGGLSSAGNSGSLFYTSLFGDVTYLTGAFSYRVTRDWTLGIGAIYENDGVADYTGESNGQPVSLSTFVPHAAQYVIGADYRLTPSMNVGVTWTQYERQQYNLTGTGADIGIGVKLLSSFFETITYGKNIFSSKVKYSSGETEKLPVELGLSIKTYPLKKWFNTTFYGQIRLQDDHALKGFGVQFSPLSTQFFKVNAGFKDKYQIGQSIRSTLCAGVVLSIGGVSFEYGYDTTDVYDQQTQQYFSVSMKL